MPGRSNSDPNEPPASQTPGPLGRIGSHAILRCKGYRILTRRARTRVVEIDIVARQGDTLVFVEVKLRRTLDSGHQALHPAARQRIDAATRVLTPSYLGGCSTTRIDAILIKPWRWPEHLVAAWREI